jgi:hypothetical protein
MPKLSNPLVECEHRPEKIELQQIKQLPIQVHYSKDNKTYTIVIEIPK